MFGKVKNDIIISILREVCRTRPDLEFFISPTTIRSKPQWYTGAQPSISRLIQMQIRDQHTRALPLPGYLTDPAALDPDGVHFLPMPGLHYVMHLIDSAR
jgi:hypothetical protein